MSLERKNFIRRVREYLCSVFIFVYIHIKYFLTHKHVYTDAQCTHDVGTHRTCIMICRRESEMHPERERNVTRLLWSTAKGAACERCLQCAPAVHRARVCLECRARATCLERLLNCGSRERSPWRTALCLHHPAPDRIRSRRGRRGVWRPASRGGDRPLPPLTDHPTVYPLFPPRPPLAGGSVYSHARRNDISRNLARVCSSSSLSATWKWQIYTILTQIFLCLHQCMFA